MSHKITGECLRETMAVNLVPAELQLDLTAQ